MVSKPIINQNEIIMNQDEVRSAVLARANFIHYSPKERLSPPDRIKQTIVRQEGVNEPQVYYAYDVVYLRGQGFPIGQEVYIIVDGKAFPVCVDGTDHETITRIEELAKDMSTAI